jgi:hypothetical protein
MTEAQKVIIAELATLIPKIDPRISKLRAERIAGKVPVHVVELKGPIDGKLHVVRNRELEIFVQGIVLGIESERD